LLPEDRIAERNTSMCSDKITFQDEKLCHVPTASNFRAVNWSLLREYIIREQMISFCCDNIELRRQSFGFWRRDRLRSDERKIPAARNWRTCSCSYQRIHSQKEKRPWDTQLFDRDDSEALAGPRENNKPNTRSSRLKTSASVFMERPLSYVRDFCGQPRNRKVER
jgi:hypothetical protein